MQIGGSGRARCGERWRAYTCTLRRADDTWDDSTVCVIEERARGAPPEARRRLVDPRDLAKIRALEPSIYDNSYIPSYFNFCKNTIIIKFFLYIL